MWALLLDALTTRYDLAPAPRPLVVHCSGCSSSRVVGVCVQGAPTQAVLAHEAFKQKKAKLAAKSQQATLEKYGDAAAAKPDEALLLPESEAYVEYDRSCAACLLVHACLHSAVSARLLGARL